MVIKNSTCWRTDQLRMIFRRCVKEVDKIEKPNVPFHKRNKHFKLTIGNGKHNFSGSASINGYSMWLKIPKEVDWSKGSTWFKSNNGKESLARLIIHEYYHNLGYRYHDKNNYKHDTTKTFDVNWVNQYPIEQKEIVKKPDVDIKLLRYQRAIKNLQNAETRYKRAKTLYKKWDLKVKRYETVYGFKKTN